LFYGYVVESPWSWSNFVTCTVQYNQQQHYSTWQLYILYTVHGKNPGLSKSGLRAVHGAPLGQRLAVGQLAAPPLPSLHTPSSSGIILACPLSPSSWLPSSFLNLYSSVPHLRSTTQHLISPPLLLAAAPYSLLHSRSIHLFFTFCFPEFCTLVCCWC
jgi:hypothetical protein